MSVEAALSRFRFSSGFGLCRIAGIAAATVGLINVRVLDRPSRKHNVVH